MRFRDLIDQIGISALHKDAELNIGYTGILRWKQRDSIPPHAWRAVLRVARQKGIQVTVSDLLDMAEEKRKS